MYRTQQELFGEAVESLGEELSDHEQFMVITACASTFLAVDVGDVGQYSHEQLLLLSHNLGFALPTHEALRLVVALVERTVALKEEQRRNLLQAPFQSFDGLFYQDRHGRLMARFSMGDTTFSPIFIEEEWEEVFVRVYHDSLARALALKREGIEDGIHQPEDGQGTHE